MSSDISRAPDDGRGPNTGIVAQQGRVIVDRDLNTLHTIVNTRAEAEARDVIGASGTPDDGFAVGLPEGSPPFWVPPAPLGLGHEPAFDFLIKPGTMYIGGQRIVFPAQQGGETITYAYFDQPDWPSPSPPVFRGETREEAVYLHAVEHELSAVEDPDLLDVALGGVDTTQRLRLVRRVERATVTSANCADAWAELTKTWLTRGLSFDAQTMRLTPTTKLLVGFDQSVAPPDPCDPVVTGGYLGADNQLIRVEIASAAGIGSPAQPPQLLWGYDDASFLYRVSGITANGTMLQLASDPPDAFHTPQANQAVEILRTAAIIGGEPDETDPTGQRTIVRCVAEETGFVTTLTQPYGPAAAGSTTKVLTLAQGLPAAYLSDTNPLFVRVWQGQQAFTIGVPLDLVDPVTTNTTGVQVTISNPTGETLAVGSFWRLAVRPSTPQAVYPECLLTAPQPPDGPREWVCPLAVINWRAAPAQRVHDCRQHFDNLVTLSKRPPGCCTVNVAPSDITATDTLQALVDRAAALAEQVTVCLGPGIFELPDSLRLNAAHNHMTISACAGGATLQAAETGAPTGFSDGLVVITDASGLTLRGLHMTVPAGSLPADLLAIVNQLVALENQGGPARDATNTAGMIGVRAVFADTLTIDDCTFQFPQLAGALDIIGIALFLQGDCAGLTVRDCTFDSAMPPTFTRRAPPATNVGVVAAPAATTAAEATEAAPAATATAATNLFRLDAASRLKALALQTPIGIVVTGSPPAPAPLIATAGVLAVVNTTSGICRLGDETFRGNSFTNLTMIGLLVDVDAGIMRVQDNRASGCVAGLWLLLNGLQPPTGVGVQTELNAFTAAIAFDEFDLIFFGGEIYPIPAGATGKPNPTITPTSLFLTNNEIETIPFSGGQSSTTLFLWTNREVSTTVDTTTSLVLSGNRLRSQSFRARTAPSLAAVPTVAIIVPDSERCAVTGNLILNENFANVAGSSGGSLLIIPNSSSTVPGTGQIISNVSLLAVTGNVLLGTTNLGALLRSPTAGDTWLPYNSIQ
jgi:hypothetical protein